MGLREKYAYAVQTAKDLHMQGAAEERDGKLHFHGTVDTQEQANKIWDAIKTIPDWKNEVVADVKATGANPAGTLHGGVYWPEASEVETPSEAISPRELFEPLTTRQAQALELLGQDKSNAEIAGLSRYRRKYSRRPDRDNGKSFLRPPSQCRAAGLENLQLRVCCAWRLAEVNRLPSWRPPAQ